MSERRDAIGPSVHMAALQPAAKGLPVGEGCREERFLNRPSTVGKSYGDGMSEWAGVNPPSSERVAARLSAPSIRRVVSSCAELWKPTRPSLAPVLTDQPWPMAGRAEADASSGIF